MSQLIEPRETQTKCFVKITVVPCINSCVRRFSKARCLCRTTPICKRPSNPTRPAYLN